MQISLPSTAVVDISVLQTIVNAINRLDDAVSQLTDPYGYVAVSDSNATASEFSSVFNSTTHQIQFGRKVVDGSGTSTDIEFKNSFADGTKPIFVATVREDSTENIMVHTKTLTNSKANVYVSGAATTVYVHWIAIGTRGNV